MSSLTAPQLQLSFEFAETLVHHLQEASRQLDAVVLLRDAEALRAQITAQTRAIQPEH
ncbi:MAG: hypothetical protein HGB30_05600 [Holophagaceae bacterium]|nr:hypothetical protein [Holophagaceae bacterium]